GTGLAAAVTAEIIRFVVALPLIVYSFKGRAFYAAIWRRNRFWGWASAVGAAFLLGGFTARTVVYSSQFAQRILLTSTPVLLIALLLLGFAVYSAVKGAEAQARAGVLFLAAAAVITLLVILADIPYMRFDRELPQWTTELFVTDLIDRLTRSGEYLVFAALLPYVRDGGKAESGTRSGAAVLWYALAGVLSAALLCVFFGAVLGEYQSMTEYPLAAAASLSDIVLFKRLDGITGAVWTLAAAFRCGMMLFSAFSILGECRKKEVGA
ncbi:MAG TPA: hypothetical protein DDY65_04885, partial [Ruminococcaceae bacterium]|nr:hypothetical protein [Oscillospiraceae bacterium]